MSAPRFHVNERWHEKRREHASCLSDNEDMKRVKQVIELPWVGYVRVSTKDQAESGLSLESQEAKIRAMATVKGVTLAEVLIDRAESAKSLDRPRVQDLLAMIRARKIAGVIIAKLDRLTRSVRDLGALVDLFQAHEVSIISTYETLDTTTANGRMILNITATIAQWEREVICERTRDALGAKLRRGEHAGNVAYGFRSVDGRAVEDEQEQAIIRLATEYRGEGLSLASIATKLNEAGHLTRRGTEWKLQYVDRILRSRKEADA